ncbi:MAG: PKD domain-containing protein [Candidatus Bathyarchaeota archaeon]|nr:PKD domain-containing protein [Candidatus Bathyarchaeota archaeon]
MKAYFTFYNNAPNRPSLTGPTSGYVGETYTYTARATDPDGDKIKYKFYWRDGTTTTTGFYSSGDYVSRSHSWGSAGTYYVYVEATDYYGAYKSSYTLTVTIVNRAPNTPSRPSGSTSGYVGTYYYYLTSTTDPDGDDVKYKFDWGDYSYTTTGYYSSGATVRAGHKWSTTGYKSVRVKACDVHGEWSGWSSSLQVYIREGGSGGCPILYVYDGSEYVEEGLLDIHNPEGIDVVYEHTLASTPQRVDGTYLLRLTEHPKTHSYIDQVKLYAVLEDETVIELPLIWAWHSEDGNVLPMLLHSDEWKADVLGADLNDGTSQSIDLKFAALSPNLEVAGFVFQIEGNNMLIK